ncbi:MAG: MerR family transcriptional regulator [Clostridia bacterium]|nr:MerR family transcriptional regulator [Clostridia bacterium]
MTVKQVSDISGVSIRTLQYYDDIGLLKPSRRTEGGYREYSAEDIETLFEILLFKEMEFELKEIRRIITDKSFDRRDAINQQIALLEMKKEHLENLIEFLKGMQLTGGKGMSFSAFDKGKIDEYTRRAKEKWGETKEYKEFEGKSQKRSKIMEGEINRELMEIFCAFAGIRDQSPESKQAAEMVNVLQKFISEHFYACSDEILLSLGKMYACGGEFTENIDRCAGSGTAAFVNEAICHAKGNGK